MKKNNQNGQALLELIIFLPLMFMFYSMIAGFANAINGSINQQKVTRAYFYYRVQNNSTIPKPSTLNPSWKQFGMFFIGWKDYFDGSGTNAESGKPVAPCYRVTVPLGTSSSDGCMGDYTTPSTMFIRVQTVYGVCGGTYAVTSDGVSPIPDVSGADFVPLVSRDGCLIQ